MSRRSLLAIASLLAACTRDRPDDAARAQVAPPPPAADACAKAKPHGTLAWIADDFPAALACAKAKQLPIVLDLWAPWCHTCLSMQSTVFADRSLEAVRDKFVFVALDTDRDVNAAFVAKYPPTAWPTFYVIAPDEAVLSRFVGAASIRQFHAFLDTGARVMAGGTAGADARLLSADRLLQAKQLADAERELAAALEAAPKDWARRPDALVSLIHTRGKLKDYAGCATLAEATLAGGGAALGTSASASDFMSVAVDCAKAVEKAQPERAAKLRERAVARWEALIADERGSPMSVDDRSDAMMYLRETLIALDKPDRAKAIAERQRAMLDDAAAKAATPMAAMTYNWPRAEVYVYLGHPLDLVPALEQSIKDLPTEYDPPARLGWIYWKGGKLDDAVKWTDKAIALAYGPRKTRVLTQRAEIAKQQGDKAAEKRYREQIVAHLEALPAAQTTPEAIAKAKQAVLDVDNPPPPAP